MILFLNIGLIILAVISVILSLYYLFKLQLKYKYGVLSTPKEVNAYINELQKFNEQENIDKNDDFYVKEVDELLLSQYIDNTEINFINNDIKSKFQYKLKIALMFSTIFIILSAVHIFFSEKEEPQYLSVNNCSYISALGSIE